MTAILCAKCEPWRSWAAHLVSFGAQAALVAGTPYYKLLVGRMLGYKEENVRYHIQVTAWLWQGGAGRANSAKLLHALSPVLVCYVVQVTFAEGVSSMSFELL